MDKAQAVIGIDPVRAMAPESDDAWADLIVELTARVKLRFAQRPDEVLATSPLIAGLVARDRDRRDRRGAIGRQDGSYRLMPAYDDSLTVIPCDSAPCFETACSGALNGVK